MEATADYFQLVFTTQLHEVYSIAGNTDCKLRIFLGMFHRIIKHLAVQNIYVQVVSAFGEVTVHHCNEIFNAVFFGSSQ